MMDIDQIMKAIPHRFPFLLVDKVLEIEPGKRAVAIKNVTINEPFFQGHFPHFPIMPGVLIVEAMAQVGAIAFGVLPESEGRLPFFAGIDMIRFRRPVRPGDQLRIEIEVLKVKGMMGKMKGVATVDGAIAAEGEIMFSMVEGALIHPSAVIHPSAKIGANVSIGANTVIGPEVEIGDKTRIGSSCIVARWTKIGKENRIYHGVAIGTPPQDLHYKGEKSFVEIGDRNIIREFVTIHMATGEGQKTIVGNDNFIMVHAHIPHNATLGNQIVIGGYVGMGGHVTIEDQAVIGGMAGVHQFVRIGKLAMVGAHSKIVQDVPPYMLVDGNPAQIRSMNAIGMERRGVSPEAQAEIKKVFRILYKSGFKVNQAIEDIKAKAKPCAEVDHVLEFLAKDSDRGISKKTEGEEEETV